MEYSDYVKHSNPPVDAFIMQGPVSDREAMSVIFPSYEESIVLADSMIAAGKAGDCLPGDKIPKAFAAPISAYRFKSLAAKGYVTHTLAQEGPYSRCHANHHVLFHIL